MPNPQVIPNPDAMRKFAQEIAAQLSGGQVLLLTGELGCGKTTFAQAIARALGITQSVTSPTFTIVAEYPVPNHKKIKTLVHVDLYRLDDDKAATDPALIDVLAKANDSDRLTIIEWAEKLGAVKLPNSRWIKFEHGKTEGERLVSML